MPEPETNTTRAGVVMATWVEKQSERPPSRVVGQLAREVKTILLDGATEDLVIEGLDEWQMMAATKGAHPSLLASVVHNIQARRSRPAGQGALQRSGHLPVSDAELRERALNPHLHRAVPA